MASSDRIEELRRKFEENPRRYFAPLANEYRKAGDVDQAIAICRDYLPQQPGHMSGHIVYGQALYEARQYEEAKSVFETALALDPENLIALRHLGDICLLIGDIEGARTWYGRVLDADPRNEEIQAQLLSLEASSAPAVASAEPTPISSPAVPAAGAESPGPGVVESLSSAPTVVVSPPTFAVEKTAEQPAVVVRHDEPSATPASSAPTAEIVLDQMSTPVVPEFGRATPPPSEATPETAMTLGFEPTSAPTPTSATQPIELDRVVPAMPETSAMDSFRLDGLETTSMASAEQPREPAPEASSVPLLDLEIATSAASPGSAESAATTPPFEPASAAPPVPELLDLNESPAMTAPVRDAKEAPGAAVPSADLPLIDLGEPVSRADADAGECDTATTPPGDAMVEATAQALSVAPPEARSALQAPAAPPPPAALPALTEARPTPVAESRPFVTETMAELYEQQGHRDEALKVYRALLEQRPGDGALQGKIDALLARQGPTIRELLALVASRRPAPPASAQPPAETLDEFSGVGGPPAEAPDALEAPALAAATSPAGLAAAPAAVAEPVSDASAGAGGRPDVLAGLFGNAQVSSRDETAARTLARVFAAHGQARTDSLAGAPARPAAKDLSLESVFGKEGGSQPAAFSFDQFFSQRSTESPAAPARRGEGTPESADDIAKFTQWLEGLKPR